jgi:pyruvate/2-oxoglutarate dehydrogenase complex dihydrolipoamide acyltransferase (E2) component
MPTCELVLPELGLGDRLIKVSLWLVERGSRVVEGDPLVELLAGEATVDLPSPATGVLIKKMVAEDEPVHVGQRLAVIAAEVEDPDDDPDDEDRARDW